MKTRIILVAVLGLLTSCFILNDFPQVIMNHGIEIACANNGNHYAYGHDNSNDGNHYAYGHARGNNNGTQETTASVPEPSTLLLLGAGLAGIGIFRRRFKK